MHKCPAPRIGSYLRSPLNSTTSPQYTTIARKVSRADSVVTRYNDGSNEWHIRRAQITEEVRALQKVLNLKTAVLPGGNIEIVDRELPAGESADVVASHPTEPTRRSAVDIIDEAPGHLLFKSAEEVDSYLKEERASWNG